MINTIPTHYYCYKEFNSTQVTIAEKNENIFDSIIDYSVKGNRLKVNDLGEIEIIAKPPAYIIGEYLRYAIDITSNYAKDFFSSFLPKTLEIDEIRNCKKGQKKAIESMSLCEKPKLCSDNHSECFTLLAKGDLESNLLIANEILLDTIKDIQFSANNLARSQKIFEKKAKEQGIDLVDLEDISYLTYETWDCISHCRTLSKTESDKQKGSLFIHGKNDAVCASKIFMGQCTEMSMVALFKGMKKGIWNTHLDIVVIENGDHVVAVLGRDFGSDPEDYKTWGQSAVVIDVWTHEVYKLSEVETHLNDFLVVDPATGKPTLRLFNPQWQRLKVKFGNICSTHDLLSSKQPMNAKQGQLFNEIIQELEKFHQTENLQVKLNAANEIYELCTHPEILFFEKVILLRDQVNHFIELNHYSDNNKRHNT